MKMFEPSHFYFRILVTFGVYQLTKMIEGRNIPNLELAPIVEIGFVSKYPALKIIVSYRSASS